ncbi:MAG: hypothetical protein MZU84_06610 [Sphingobacterium sp.]|nr:hypothetical protein [Sphingobacterium sp.]
MPATSHTSKDGAPNATGIYKGKDDCVDYISQTPLRLTPDGQTQYTMNAEFLTSDDMETDKDHHEYIGITCAAVSGKLDFRVSSTINLSFGGTFTMYDNNELQLRRFHAELEV